MNTSNDNQNPQSVNLSIPDNVIDALAEVRDSCLTNMLDRRTVIAIIDSAGDYETVTWLDDNKSRYMEALIQMGETR